MRFQAPSAILRFALAGSDEVRRRNLVAHRLADGLFAVPAWEERLKVHLYDRGRLGPKPPESVIALARQGPVGGPQQVERRRSRSGATIWVARHGTPWVSTGILAAEPWVVDSTDDAYDPLLGLIFAVPTRSTLYVHVLGHPGGLDAAAELAMAAHQGFHHPQESADVRQIRPTPAPVSPGLYWYKAGKIERLEADVHTTSVQLHPSDTFITQVIRPLAQ